MPVPFAPFGRFVKRCLGPVHSGYDVVRLLVALLLLLAGGLKAHQLATEPIIGSGLLDNRWLLMATVEFEFLARFLVVFGCLAEADVGSRFGSVQRIFVRVPLQGSIGPRHLWLFRSRASQSVVYHDAGCLDHSFPCVLAAERSRAAILDHLPSLGRSDGRCHGGLAFGWSSNGSCDGKLQRDHPVLCG